MRSWKLAVCGAVVTMAATFASPPLPADTIYLKDGSQILDCKIVSETPAAVSLRSPAGDMVVPRDQIHRMQKSKTVYDQFQEQMARLKTDDAAGRFKLAQWCRTTEGLRNEVDKLLLEVIALSPEHESARRLLGHVKTGSGWVIPKPLAIRLAVAGSAGAHRADLEKQLGLFLRSRAGVRLAATGETIAPTDACELKVSLSLSLRAGTNFLGKTLGRSQLGASVDLLAQADWIGKGQVKTCVVGSVPAGGPGAERAAIQNAVGLGGKSLHKLIDDVLLLRAQRLTKDLRGSEPKEKRRAGPTAGGKSGARLP